MNHPDDAQLAELAEGTLKGETLEGVEGHVSQCETCRLMLAQLLKALVPEASSSGPHKGLVIGRYVVLEPIGAGALGEVFAAWDTTLQRTVALKWLYPSVREADRPQQRERLILEARALAKVQHPNVVAVHDVEAQGSHDVIVMELVANAKSLRGTMSEGRPWKDVLPVFLDAARGLIAAHAASVIHRDFKPDNVLVDPSGRVRVADFGLARSGSHATAVDAASKRSTLSGTPAYLAAERWQGADATELSDQFSFCAALYECLGGKLPFDEKDPGRRIAQMKVGAAPLATVPSAISQVVVRGLAFEPEQRWPSMAALSAALSTASHRPERIRAGLALAAVVTLALGSAVLAIRQAAGRCDDVAMPIDAAWNTARKEKVSAAFLATNHPAAAELTPRVLAAADAVATSLSSLRRAACEATNRQGESEAALALRDGCLQRRVADFAALVTVFESADRKMVERAIGALEQLPSAKECLDVAALAAIDPLPASRALVDAAAQKVSRVRALRLAGKTKDSAALAEEAVTEARAAAWRPLLAEALGEAGSTLERLQKGDEARAKYLESLNLAFASNDLPEAYSAAVGLAYLDGVNGTRLQAAEAWVAVANGLIEPAGLKGTASATRVGNAIGVIHVRNNRHAEAVKTFADLARQLEALGMKKTVAYARVLANANGALREIGKPDEALALSKESLQIMEAALSPNHPDVSTATNNIGSALADMKKYDEADPYFRRTVELRTKLFGADSPVLATPLYNLGELAFRRGDGETALTEYGRARELIEKAQGPDADDVFDARMGEGLAMGLLAHHQQSLDVLDATLPELMKRKLPAWNIAQAQLGIARALKALNKDLPRAKELAKAVAALEGERHAEQRAEAVDLLTRLP